MSEKKSELEQEFLQAYDSHADAIFRHIYLRIGDREDAKDILQESFIKAWEYARKGKEIENIRAFLYHIAGNLLIDTVRSRKRRPAVSLEDLQEEGYDVESEPEDHGMRIDAEAIVAVLQKVEEPYRTAVILRHIDGFHPKEIAVHLGVSANVVSVRIHRGMEQLRSFLEPNE